MATMTTHSGRSSATGPASHEASQEAFADLVQQVELAGYYPELVLDTLRLATGEEEILSGMVQSETTFAEAVHRHLTVLALTPSRLIIVHVDDTPRDDGSPGALATSEAVPLSRIRSMALTMEPATCADPDCQADHGMTGVSVPDDVVIRVAAGVEGAAALARAETFAGRLSQMAARAAAL